MKTLLPLSGRRPAYSASLRVFIVGFLALALAGFSSVPALAQKYASDPHQLYLQGERPVSVSFVGKAVVVQALKSGQLKPVTLAAGDVDGDGIEDVVAGYAGVAGGVLVIYRGNLDAFAPQSQASWQATGAGKFPNTFLLEAKAIALPESPDFLLTGNFVGGGALDVVVAARGSRTLYILAGDGRGGLLAPQAISVMGSITTLGAARFDASSSFTHIVVGTTDQTGDRLSILESTAVGIGEIATIPLRAAATSLAFGNLTGEKSTDMAIVAGGDLQLVHGREIRAARAGARSTVVLPEAIPVPFAAATVVSGSFIAERSSRQQIAVLGTDGSVHIVTRSQLDARPWDPADMLLRRRAQFARQPDPLATPPDPAEGWKVAESFPAIVSASNPKQPPVFFRTRISSRGADDLMMVDSGQAQLHVLSRENPQALAAIAQSLPASFHSTLAMNASQTTVAGIPMRVNIDGRPGVVVLKQGQIVPQVMMPLPDPTFFVNRADDPVPGSTVATCNNVSNVDVSSSCSLREAILKANATSGTDTIMLAAGTYTLSRPRVANDFSGAHGTLEVTDSLNITGAVDGSGHPASIIQGGTNLTTSVDKVFSFNQDISALTDATVSISNLVIQNGHNRGDTTIFDGWGGAFDFDTGNSGNNTLTVTNCNITTNTLTEGEGGGLAIFNTNNGTGFAHIVNSTIQNNIAVAGPTGVAGNGGGIFLGTLSALVMSNSKVVNNQANANAGSNPVGGGMELIGPSGNAGQSAIHASIVSANTSASDGGGIWNTTDLLIDTASAISNNTSGGNGGGLWHNAANPDAVTLSKVTISGNAATSGGGIFSGNSSGGVTLTMHFSRLAGNTATSGTNLTNDDSTVAAIDNWWGTNAPASTIVNTTTTAAITPFLALTHTATPSTIQTSQTSTLTASFLRDSAGTAVSVANLDVLLGLPITFNNAVLGTISAAQTVIQPNGTATATFTAGATGGAAHADAVVDNGTATANITIPVPPVIIKAFGAATIPLNGSTSLSFTIQNNNTGTTLSGVGFTDALPTGLVISTPNGVTGTCGGGTITATAGSGSASLSGATLLSSTSCTFSVNVTGTTAGTKNNTTSAVTSVEGGTGGTASASVNVLAVPTIAKAFGAATVPLNGSTSLTLTLTNSNSVGLTGIAVADTFPAGLVVTTPNGIVNTCGGTATAVAGSGSLSLSGGAVAANTSCTLTINVTGTAPGVLTNTTGAVASTNGGTGNTGSANLTVTSAPTITKAFGAASVPLSGSTSLTFTIQNANAAVALSGIAFTDTLPAGLVVATPSALTTTCGGTAVAGAGSGTATLSGATLAASTSCTYSVNVTGSTVGVKNNSVSVSSTNGGTGNTSNASITIVGAPVLIKAFGAASIPLNGSTSLSFTVQNNNTTTTLTGTGFSDTLPAGMVISTPNGLTGSCGGGTITSAAGSAAVTLAGASLAASTSCTFSVNVTGTAAGTKNNTTGNVSATEGGTGGTASASVSVVPPPSIAKSFGAAFVALNGSTSLTFTITNPAASPGAESGVAFSDTFPAGLVVATPNGLSNTCGGTTTAVAGSGAIGLTGGGIATPNTSCTIVVNVTGVVSGQLNNTTGTVSSTNGGTGNTAAANLSVASPPTISKAFGAASSPVGGVTSLTFTLQNPNAAIALSGLAFTDALPAGLVLATPSGIANTCGGTATATAGASSTSLVAGTLPASGSCTFSVNVTGSSAGVKNNSVQVTATEGGVGNTSNASITIVSAPVIIKAFGAASVPLNGSTSLSFTIQNNNTAATLSGIGFTDAFPAGLAVSTPNGLTGSCGGGTITATAGANSISLGGATLAGSSSCTFSINVTGLAAGTANNTTNAVTSGEGGTGGTASASINIVAPASIAKVFGSAGVPLNGTTSLTFTITNPTANAVTEIGVAFTDTFPVGLVVGTPNGLTNTCGGTATAVAGTAAVSLTGATVAAHSNCTLTINATGAVSGNFTNTTGAVSSTNGGTGNTASANLSVAAPPTITKTFGAATIPVNGLTSLSFTIVNPATNSISLTGVAFTDNLPAGLIVATPNGLTSTCSGTTTATAGSSAVSLGAATLASNASCTVFVNVTGTTAGVKNNSVLVTSAEGGNGNTANASVTVTAAALITKAFGATSIPLNGTTALNFTIQNSNTTTSLTGVGFGDTLPAGLVIATPNGLIGSCGGGTITAAPASGSASLSGATLAASSSCTFSVNVTGIAAGMQNNTTGNVVSIQGGTGGTASASLDVVAPPAIAKVFAPAGIAPGAISTLTLTIANPAANTVAETGVGFIDTLPAGLVISTPNTLTSSCGGTTTAAAGSGVVTLTSGAIPAASTCSISVNVTGTTAGTYTNTTGAVSSTNGGTGNVASANLMVASPPSITKSFGAASIGLGGSTSLTFTITNPVVNGIALTGVSFADNLPSGLVVATPNALTGSCGGTVTAAAGSASVTLTAGTIAASGTCTFSINVAGTAAGIQINVTGNVGSANGGTGNTATASITVLAPDLTIAKSHTGSFYQGQTNATYALTVNNIGPGPSTGAVTVTDSLPTGLTATGVAGSGWNCTVATISCTRSDALGSNASYPAIVVTVSVAANAPFSVTNTAAVAGGGELNTANNSASDITTITLPPDFTLGILPGSILLKAGQQADYELTVTPVNTAFTNPIVFTIAGLPGRSAAAFSPGSVTPGSNPATSTLRVTTTAGDTFLSNNFQRNGKGTPLYGLFMPLAGLVLSGIGFRFRKVGRKWILTALLLAFTGFTLYGCASSNNFQNLGTPPGNYTITVTGTSGSIQHTAVITLNVQP